jgi:hypothetical protein
MSDFYGLPTRSIRNQHLQLDYLLEGGLRIVRLKLAGTDENLLAEIPDVHWPTPTGEYYLRGGHRLWLAPESTAFSYTANEGQLTFEEAPNGLRLVQPIEANSGIRKSISIELVDDEPCVTLSHEMRNESARPVFMAPWAITVMPLGGLAVMPYRGPSQSPGLLPDRHVTLWPYTRWQDSRLNVTDEFIYVAARTDLPPCKIGCLNHPGWIGYLNRGALFVKQFQLQTDRLYPDLNCNAEIYCNVGIIELESLGPTCLLQPGQSVIHVETWRVYQVEGALPTPDDLQRVLRSIGLQAETDQTQ